MRRADRAAVKILAISDVEMPQLLNAEFLQRTYGDVDVLVSCGDMPVDYLDFVSTVLSCPLFYVRGNHDTTYHLPPLPGGDNLHGRFVRYKGYWFAGLEGSPRYNRGAVQYSEAEMFALVLQMMPRLLARRVRYGYGVHVFVTHAPPFGVHDLPNDYAHRGFRAFRYLIRWAQPRYLLHGHVDTWDRRKPRKTVLGKTTVLNINPYMVVALDEEST